VIRQDGTPPHTMTCDRCGAVWDPPPARGKDAPTDSSLDHSAITHWQECEKRD